MKSEWKTGLKARTSADNFLKKSLSSNYFTYQQIFEMLVPLIMDQFFVSIIGLLTTAMISSSSQESVSAVSLVSPIYAMTYAIFSSISAAGTVIIAQYKGNGNMNMVPPVRLVTARSLPQNSATSTPAFCLKASSTCLLSVRFSSPL